MVAINSRHIRTHRIKKLRAIENHGEAIENHGDRFRYLSEDVIIHILSCLATKDAVRTSILSRNWKNRWNDIYNIDLDDKGKLRGKLKIANFVTSVGNVLDSTHNSRIRRFRISCKTYDSKLLTTWIHRVLMRNVQDLVIEAKSRGAIVLSPGISNLTSLTKLKLSSNYILNVPGQICFPNLKNLYLSSRSGRGNGMFCIRNEQSPDRGHILLIFPALKELVLKYCKWLDVKHVEIQASELTRFRARGLYRNQNECEIKICAAKLEKFESDGEIQNFVLSDVSSVNHVALRHKLGLAIEKSRFLTILRGVSGMKRLTLSGGMIQDLARLLVLPAFDQVKRLEISSWGTYNPHDLLNFLQLLPSLESLNLNSPYQTRFVYKQGQVLPPCVVSGLKEVEFTDFRGQESDIDTVKFFLENAKNLQRALVCVARRSCRMKKIEISHLLLTLLPEGSSCKVDVELQKRFM